MFNKQTTLDLDGPKLGFSTDPQDLTVNTGTAATFVAIGTAHHDFSYSVPQDQRYGFGYFDHFRPGSYPSPYWSYPYVPAKMAVAATKERLWANKYMNPNSVHWQVQETKERLWAIKNPYYGN